jgi:hypothetical protein
VKTRPVGAEFIHADGQTEGQTDKKTDRHTHTHTHTDDDEEANSRFLNFVNAAKINSFLLFGILNLS